MIKEEMVTKRRGLRGKKRKKDAKKTEKTTSELFISPQKVPPEFIRWPFGFSIN